jgi:hypothetical protein
VSGRWIVGTAALALASASLGQDRPGLTQLADQLEYAMVAGDYRSLPHIDKFVYTENGNVLKPWDGMWNTLSAVAGTSPTVYPRAAALDYRVQIVDGDELVRLVETDENTVQGVALLHAKAEGGKLARVDALPVREEFSGARGGTVTLLQPSLPVTMEGAKVGAADPLFAAAVARPGSKRALVDAANAYFDGLLANRGAGVRFAADCLRKDNGQPVTGVVGAPLLDPAKPQFRPFALGCALQLDSGYYSNIRAVRDRRFWADPARGLVLAQVQMDVPGTVLSFDAPGFGQVNYPGPRGPVQTGGQQFEGRILNNMISPLTMSSVFLFKIEDGAIRRIDAFYRGAPYGWRMNW